MEEATKNSSLTAKEAALEIANNLVDDTISPIIKTLGSITDLSVSHAKAIEDNREAINHLTKMIGLIKESIESQATTLKAHNESIEILTRDFERRVEEMG